MDLNLNTLELTPNRYDEAPWVAADAPRNFTRGWYPLSKAVVEYVAALVLLAATMPVLLAAAVLVKFTSRGPAIYSQIRLGRNGRPFPIYKIRTMYHDCERVSGVCWASARDPRVTPIGHILRLTHVDELPQLLNVLRGDMSLIGPRPERPEIIRQLETKIPRYWERLDIRPGVTGLAQVQSPADSGLESVRNKLAYDLYYIKAETAWLDLRILLATALKMFGGSFGQIRQLFGMPGWAEVEGAYAQPAVAAPVPSTAETYTAPEVSRPSPSALLPA